MSEILATKEICFGCDATLFYDVDKQQFICKKCGNKYDYNQYNESLKEKKRMRSLTFNKNKREDLPMEELVKIPITHSPRKRGKCAGCSREGMVLMARGLCSICYQVGLRLNFDIKKIQKYREKYPVEKTNKVGSRKSKIINLTGSTHIEENIDEKRKINFEISILLTNIKITNK